MNNVTLFASVAPESKAHVERAAMACGVSLSEMVDHMLVQFGKELDHNDVPASWDRPAENDGELDLHAS